MTEVTEKKAAAKKPAAKKATPKKGVAKKAAPKKPGSYTKADGAKARASENALPAAPKRGRPPGAKTAAKKTTRGRRKKNAPTFAYMLLTPDANGGPDKAGTINGPFKSEADALDDSSIMADETTTIVIYREMKRGKVQKSTKFVAGK